MMLEELGRVLTDLRKERAFLEEHQAEMAKVGRGSGHVNMLVLLSQAVELLAAKATGVHPNS